MECKTASAARHWKMSAPQTEATTFAFSAVFTYISSMPVLYIVRAHSSQWARTTFAFSSLCFLLLLDAFLTSLQPVDAVPGDLVLGANLVYCVAAVGPPSPTKPCTCTQCTVQYWTLLISEKGSKYAKNKTTNLTNFEHGPWKKIRQSANKFWQVTGRKD